MIDYILMMTFGCIGVLVGCILATMREPPLVSRLLAELQDATRRIGRINDTMDKKNELLEKILDRARTERPVAPPDRT